MSNNNLHFTRSQENTQALRPNPVRPPPPPMEEG